MELEEQPIIEPTTVVDPPKPPEPPPDLPLSEHAKQYPVRGRFDAKPDPEPPVEPEPEKHRPAKQKAKAEDVPRIAELTKNWRQTEKERDALKAEVEALKARSGSALLAADDGKRPSGQSSEPAVVAFPSFDAWLAKNPDKSYEDYTDARTDWRYEQRQAADAKAKADSDAQAQQAAQLETWNTRLVAAREKYPDFDAVVLKPKTTPIPQGSPIDQFIWDDDAGADVVYHLLTHTDEVAALLALRPIQQLKALTLLAQRLTTPPRTSDASTGSSTAPPVTSVPKPPNPVRTGPMRTGDELPDPEKASLAEHRRAYYPRMSGA